MVGACIGLISSTTIWSSFQNSALSNDIALGVCYFRELSALFWIVFRTNLCSINIIAGQNDGMPEGYFKVQKSAKSSVVGCPAS